MKKLIVRILPVILLLTICFGGFSGCTARANTLKIYNWGEYMDEDVVDEFKEWYEEETGEKVKVVYKTYDGNEALLTAIETKGESWDLVCPSDYMIDRMIKKNLVKKVDKEILGIDYDTYWYDGLVDLLADIDPNMDYTIPYIWGTFGIMYDTTDTSITANDVKSWGALFDSKFSGKIYMKDQVRDSYTVAMLWKRAATLREYAYNAETGKWNYDDERYQELLSDIFTKFNSDTIAEAKGVLAGQKSLVYKYESDNGKIEMADGTGGTLGLFWSCDAGFAMNDYESGGGCSSVSTIEGNKDLAYVVPEEGSNVWIDGWVIPSTAVNEKAANMFLKFLLSKEISIRNAQYAGAPSAGKEAMQELYDILDEDEDGFFERARTGFKQMYMEMMFPTPDILKRCAVMGDFGSSYDAMTRMWTELRELN